MVNAGGTIEYETALGLAAWGWTIICGYSGFHLGRGIIKQIRMGEEPDIRERYFAALNGAYDLEDKIAELHREAGRNKDRIYFLSEDAKEYGQNKPAKEKENDRAD
jgi:hypothetical protein